MKSFLTAAVAVLGLATVGARAQESTGPIGPATPVPGTPAVQPVAQQLSLEQLGRMLRQLGYNPKPYQDQAGKLAGYDLEFASESWTMRLSVSLSKSGMNLWLNSSVGRVVDPAGVSSNCLLKLFGEHNRIWPAYVYFFPGSGYLRLGMPIKNSGVTEATLKKEVDFYARTLRQMITLWRTSQVAPAPQPAPLP